MLLEVLLVRMDPQETKENAVWMGCQERKEAEVCLISTDISLNPLPTL